MKSLVCFVCCIFFLQVAIGQPVIIQGKILDPDQMPVLRATVLLKKKADSTVMAYTVSRKDGFYSITLNDFQPFVITVSALGFKKQHRVVEQSGSKEKTLDFILPYAIMRLQEVHIDVKRKVLVRGDTTIYRVDGFMDKTENKVEDVLKKLPGIQVDESGKIRAGGKEILKILVDGDDLTGDKYTLISQNLAAGLLDEVQLIDHYLENGLLKDLERTDDKILNLTLKKDKKKILFGELNVQGGAPENFNANVNTIFPSGKTKAYHLLSGNNIGEQQSQEEFSASRGLSTISKSFSPVPPMPDFISPLQTLEPAFIDRSRYNRNTSIFSTLNVIRKLTDKIAVKGAIDYSFNKSQVFSQTFMRYVLPTSQPSLTEVDSVKNKPSAVSTRAEMIWSPSSGQRLALNIDWTKVFNTAASSLLSNSRQLAQGQKDDPVRFTFRLNYTLRQNSQSAWLVDLAYIRTDRVSSRDVSGYNYPMFSPDQSNSTLTQTTDFSSDVVSSQFTWLKKHKGSTFSMALSLLASGSSFASQSGIHSSTPVNGFENNAEQDIVTGLLSLNYNKKWNKWSVMPSVEVSFSNMRYKDRLNLAENTSRDYPFVAPRLRISFTPGASDSFTFSYSADQQLSDMSKAYTRNIFYDYRSIQHFSIGNYALGSQDVALGYNHQSKDRMTNYYGSVFCQLSQKSIRQDLTLDTLFSYSRSVLTDRNTYSYGIRMGGSKFISTINITTDWSSVLSSSNYYNTLNTGGERESRLNFWNNQLSLVSTFDIPVNFIVLVRSVLNRTKTYLGEERMALSSHSFKKSLTLKVRLQKDCLLNLSGVQFTNSRPGVKEHLFFSDFKLVWNLPAARLQLNAEGRNLFAPKYGRTLTSSDYYEVRSEFRLNQTMVLVGCKMSF